MEKQPEKKRRGKAVKPKKGEAAAFAPGSAEAPKEFDAAAVAEKMNIWWETEGGDSFWIGDSSGWAKWPKEALGDLLVTQFVKRSKRENEFLSEMARLLVYVRQNRRVDGLIWGLAGYKAGLHTMPSGEKVIIRNASTPVQPVKGEWETIKELISGRLDLRRDNPDLPYFKKQDQVLYFHAWHKVVYDSLLNGNPGSWTQRRLLVLAGPVGCGKSRLQVMVTTGLLGGRVADPKAYLTGSDDFNANMIKAEHLMMEELDNVSQKTVDRLAFSEAIKALVANTGMTMRLMRTDPMTINPFWAATLSMNNDPDKLRSFPPLTRDFSEKVLMLLVRKADLPMPARTDKEKALFNATIAAELPAYAHWLLNEFVIPDELLVDDHGKDATRFGFRDFQHQSLVEQLYDDTPAAELMRLIDAAEFNESENVFKLWQLGTQNCSKLVGDLWEGSAINLERLLLGEWPNLTCSVSREAKKLFFHSKVDRLLARLEEDESTRIAYHRVNNARRWMISRPV